jgi:general secretion pathway protein A
LAEEAEAGYKRLAWGGMEFGGLLLGKRRGDALTITEMRPIPCEHEFGPSFHLSRADRDELRVLLHAVAAARRLEVIGWYQTSSRGLQMDAEGNQLSEEFFAEPWHVALILHRGRAIPTNFGCFVRNARGSFDPAVTFKIAELATFEEETVEIVDGPPQPSVPAPAKPVAAHPRVTAIDGARPLSDEVPREEWLQFFGLNEDPFIDTLSSSRYFEGATHLEALANLHYGIWARKGLLLLTGDEGTGKSLVLECLVEDLRREGAQLCLLSEPPSSAISLGQRLAADLRLPGSPTSPDSVRVALEIRAKQCLEQGRSPVILIDNVHRINPSVLRDLELTATHSGRGKLIQLVVTATPDFETTLQEEPALGWLKESCALRDRLEPLTAAETAGYIDHRFSRAGVTPGDLVPAELSAEAFRRTGGVPREINALFSHLLRAAYHAREKTLSTRLLVPQTILPRPDNAARSHWA